MFLKLQVQSQMKRQLNRRQIDWTNPHLINILYLLSSICIYLSSIHPSSTGSFLHHELPLLMFAMIWDGCYCHIIPSNCWLLCWSNLTLCWSKLAAGDAPPSPFFVLFWRWVGGERFGGFEAYSSELPPMQNCELLPSHFDEFASEGRGGASCKWNWAHLGQSSERIFNA